jgi:mucin-19
MLGASKAGLLGAASTADISFEYLLSDGGAAGGAGAGGGGGGGKVQEGSTTRARGVAYTVVIGAATATTAVDTAGANSNTSQFDTLVGLSSGGGGKYNAAPYDGSDGDSGGGGAGASRSGSGGTATGAGNNGAAGSASGSGPGGGGGGAGGAPSAEVGGAGITSTITGSSVTYGGGGGWRFNFWGQRGRRGSQPRVRGRRRVAS